MSKAWRTPRALSRVLVVGALILAVGLIAGAAPATPSRSVALRLAYLCRFPAASVPVGAEISAAIPVTAAVRRPIQPSRVRMTLALPHPVVARLAGLGAATVSGSIRLGVRIAAAGLSRLAVWPGALPRTAVRARDFLAVTAAGAAPPVTVEAPGAVTLAATDLAVMLTPRKADGAATAPATLTAACVPRPGQQPELAAVTVRGAATPAASPTPGAPRRTGHTPGRTGGRALARVSRRGTPPRGCGRIRKRGQGTPVCVYVTGYSDISKLSGAALVSSPRRPGLLNIDLYEHFKTRKGEQIAVSTAELDYRGRPRLPPAKATFLAFGFEPVTATLQLTELKLIPVISVTQVDAPPYRIRVTSTATLMLRISHVNVNGVPLNVGPSCETSRPISLTLVGTGTTSPPRGYNVPDGGPLSGRVRIPSFTGCGVGENLDPLFTGSISGPGNFTLLTQSKICGPTLRSTTTCPPPVPRPRR
jgi:hypothetical protein